MDPNPYRFYPPPSPCLRTFNPQVQPVHPNQQASLGGSTGNPPMSNHPYHSHQPYGQASPPFYQPPSGYAFGGGPNDTPYLNSFPESTGIEPYQGTLSYPETAGSTKRRLSAVDETYRTVEDGAQVRTKRPKRTLAEPKGESNMAKKRQELEARFGVGNITKDNKVRGSVVMSGNRMLWYDEKQRKYHACVYHHDIREDLIRIAKAMYPDYHVAPAQGLDPLDVTSNCSALSQNTWSVSTPEDRANIYAADGVSVMMLSERPQRPEPVLPPVWGHRGLVVLDQESHPILNWPELPHTLSSKLEGWRIEALRRTIPGLEISHLRARMPRNITPSKNKVQKPVYGLSTLRHRASRFRDEHQIGAWDERQGSAEKKQRFGESQSTSRVSTPAVWSQSETAISSPLPSTHPLIHPLAQSFTPSLTSPLTQASTAIPHRVSMTEQQFAEQLTQGLRNLDNISYPSPPATFSETESAPFAPDDQMQGSMEVPHGQQADHMAQDDDFDLFSSNFHQMAREFGDDIGGFGADFLYE